MTNKTFSSSPADPLNVVVIFGGGSQEHDVSVISAQQLMDAADQRKINIIPVYMDFKNQFFTGSSLRTITKFKPSPPGLKEVTFLWKERGPIMQVQDKSPVFIDCILPVLHGPFGEDGRIQSYFELLGFPVAGFQASGSAIAMRKDATKALAKANGVPTLDCFTINRLQWNQAARIPSSIAEQLVFPAVIKPVNLGSSIGVGVANTIQEASSLVECVLKWDDMAMIEPKVENLCEFNIATMTYEGNVQFSAIECPKNDSDLLDFHSKYMSASGAAKGSTFPLDGMLSLSRTINPDLPEELTQRLRKFAHRIFVALGGRGCPRMDFLYDQKSDALFFNEINPIPGSYAFFLWEAAEKRILFPELIEHLVHEAISSSLKTFEDTVPENARLLPR